MKSALREMKERHSKEEDELRNNCPHPPEYIKIKLDRSVMGGGSCEPAVEVICRNCGTQRIIFHLTSSQRKRVKKTLKAQFSGYSNADERLDCYTHYDSDLD